MELNVFRLMRITAFLLLAGFLQVSAYGLAQERITLSEKNVPLIKIFDDIQKQTSYNLWYDKKQFQNGETISIDVKNATLTEVLELCSNRLSLQYTLDGTIVTIRAKLILDQPAPTMDVKGRVINEKEEPVAGVGVTVRNSRQGAVTDMEGAFTLEHLDSNAILVFSGANVEGHEERLNGRRQLVVVLKSKINKLDEIQIIGYGTTTQRLSTGSISKVSADVIEKQPVSNPLAALEGRVAGLFIQQQNGIPGGVVNVQIRGQNSIANGNSPLYIVDGVPFNSTPLQQVTQANFKLSPFNSINPFDIESVEILKDADATSIYGSRGANGVILITTKKGKSGKTRLEGNIYTGFGQVSRMMDLLHTSEYLQMRHEAFTNDNYVATVVSDPDILKWDTTRYTDLQKVIIGGTAKITDAQLSLSGGVVNTNFLIGASYHRETTVLPGNFADNRVGFHLNLNHSSQDHKFSISLMNSFSVDGNNLSKTDPTQTIILFAPDSPPLYDSLGKLNWA
ncbi:MAG TPA: TonB-dependent receptor plug domain-containing protein, partial [Puia sp.]|nr:TonB-dependent receptor plug domain-containing protein [Puia sp.]